MLKKLNQIMSEEKTPDQTDLHASAQFSISRKYSGCSYPIPTLFISSPIPSSIF